VVAKVGDNAVTDPLGKPWFAWLPFVDDVVVEPNGQEIGCAAIAGLSRKGFLKFVEQPHPLERGS